MTRTVVIVPTYCEIDSLESLVLGVRAAVPSVHVLVVDDNSPDGTGRLADSLASHDPLVHVMHRTAKDGLGRAYLAGFAWAIEHSFDRIVEMDADGSHRPADLPALLNALDDGADAAIGTRWMPGGAVTNWPWHRRAISRAVTAYARLLLRSQLRDLTSGFRAFERSALEAIDLEHVQGAGYVFQIEVASTMERLGLRIDEVAITFIERETGRSKMSTAIVFEAIGWVTKSGLTPRR